MRLIMYMLAICFVSDVSLDIARYILDNNINDDEPWTNYDNVFTTFVFSLSTVLTFLLFFIVCMLGMIDIAKVE